MHKVALVGLAALALTMSEAAAQKRGVLGKEAPAWRVDEWFNLAGDATSINVDDFAGKVVYLYGFQSWCPGCHSHGFPTLQELIKRFDGDDSVAFIAVQTTFEGFGTNTADSAVRTVERYKLNIPVGHSGREGHRSRLMVDYRTGGTPWTIVIDRNGVVRYNDFHITPDRAERLIKRLQNEPVDVQRDDEAEPVRMKTLPEDRGGQDLIDTRFAKVKFDRWIRQGSDDDVKSDDSDSRSAEDEHASETQADRNGSPKATLYRWWTDACPACEASLPAFERLRQEYEDDGLQVVAVYHPKPIRKVDDEAIAAAADKIGFHGAIALDQDWSVLKKRYLNTGRRRATSASFLVDAKGMVRCVHPGPMLFPSADPEHAQHNSDYELLEQAIKALLQTDHAERDTSLGG